MKLKSVDGYSWLMVFVFIAALVAFLTFSGSGVSSFVSGPSLLGGGVFLSDSVSFYLVFLSVTLGVSTVFFLSGLSNLGKFMIGLSLVSSVFCYSCVHGLWFWGFYEMSMLPLLLLLVIESPYSERYMASWYLLGYVVLTSLPMLLCIFYISLENGGFIMSFWGIPGGSSVGVFLLLGILFMTKMPLPPFHVWLPIVHAEASSSVSVCLSGYIMKLGVLGVCRFCSWLTPDIIFSGPYMLMGLCMAVLFFFSASRELDGKRWLAFLSLSHMLISSVCLCVAGFDLSGVCFLYCLGHGLSAGLIFILLWCLYEVSGSRNWGILKNGLAGSLTMRCLSCACLCTAASLPPTLQFFSEVFIVSESGFVSISLMASLFVYLFMGGLVPIFLLGSLLTRHYSVGFGGSYVFGFLPCILFLVFWGFGLFLVV